LNSAYLGFNNQYDLITVNDYVAQSMASRVKVYAGSYTTELNIKATSETGQNIMQAKSVVLTASANPRTRTNPDSKLSFLSNEYAFTFFQEYTQITFRVGAALSLTKGLYYIDWTKVETEQTSTYAKSTHYHHPVKTLVEVVEAVANKYSFTAETLGVNAIVGTSTPDIGVSITTGNSPYSDVTITMALSAGSDTNITFDPSSLSYGPNDVTKYFRIAVAAAYDLSSSAQSQTVTFTSSGTDASIYSMPAN